MKKNNYYDYAATTSISSPVLEDMIFSMKNEYANASSSHSAGQHASFLIDGARDVIANKIGALPSEIIFTSGASEANNLAIKGIAFKYLGKKAHIITSMIEHKCILNTCYYLETIGFEVTYLLPNKNGEITPASVLGAIKEYTVLITIHHVNNELGTIQSIRDIGSVAFERDIKFHTDAAQSFCKLSIDVDDMDIDLLSLSAHKIYGPKGVGALYIRSARESNLVPLIHGGGQEGGIRGGTSPTSLIIGLASAVKNFPKDISPRVVDLAKLLDNYRYHRNGGVNVVPSIWNITFEDQSEQNRFFSEHNWLVSQGSACNAMSNAPSHVLSALGFDEDKARRTYRISLPPYSID